MGPRGNVVLCDAVQCFSPLIGSWYEEQICMVIPSIKYCHCAILVCGFCLCLAHCCPRQLHGQLVCRTPLLSFRRSPTELMPHLKLNVSLRHKSTTKLFRRLPTSLLFSSRCPRKALSSPDPTAAPVPRNHWLLPIVAD